MMQLGGSAPGAGRRSSTAGTPRICSRHRRARALERPWSERTRRFARGTRRGVRAVRESRRGGARWRRPRRARPRDARATRGDRVGRDEPLALALRFHKLAADQGHGACSKWAPRCTRRVGRSAGDKRGCPRASRRGPRRRCSTSAPRTSTAWASPRTCTAKSTTTWSSARTRRRSCPSVALWKLAATQGRRDARTVGVDRERERGRGRGRGRDRERRRASEGASDEDGGGEGGASRRAPRGSVGVWVLVRVRGLGDFFSPERHADLALAGAGVALCAVVAARLSSGGSWRGREPTAGRRRAVKDSRRATFVGSFFSAGAFFFSPLESRGGDERVKTSRHFSSRRGAFLRPPRLAFFFAPVHSCGPTNLSSLGEKTRIWRTGARPAQKT